MGRLGLGGPRPEGALTSSTASHTDSHPDGVAGLVPLPVLLLQDPALVFLPATLVLEGLLLVPSAPVLGLLPLDLRLQPLGTPILIL